MSWRSLEKLLFTPWPARRATLVTLITGVVLLAVLDRSAAMNSATWGVDEGQRIAESYFLRLVEAGDFDHPDWFRVATDSSHPQMSKYYFGLAVQAHGVQLPRDLALPRYYESGGLDATGWKPPPQLMPVYGPMLRPARRAVLLCNVISWMAVTWLLLRWYGAGAALLAAAIFTRHYLPHTFYASARSDALQACSFTLTLLPLAVLWRGVRGRGAVFAAVLIGVFSAVSFQTRLNGLLAFGGAAVVLIVLAIRQRDRRPIVLLALATVTCAGFALLSNPYYWARPQAAPGVAAAYLVDEPLPLRAVTRFRMQVADLGTLLQDHAYAALPSPLDRGRFVARVLFSGLAGWLVLGGAIAALVLCLRRSTRDTLLLPCVWAVSVIGVFTLWLPLGWEPYVMMIFPTAVLLAASGWSALAVAALPRRG
ncbi:MAG TPA: hypothetical protein VGF69_21290 [Thermoanaerobaculia bacterium]|jgi:hypothetical protein